MREMKLRVWDMERKNMEQIDDMRDTDYARRRFNTLEDLDVNEVTGVWMWFTGLKDKNGKDIYEGDRIKWQDGEFEVTFCNGAFKVMEMKSMFEGARDGWLHEMVSGTGFCACSDSSVPSIEIIGNIYENPDLVHNSYK